MAKAATALVSAASTRLIILLFMWYASSSFQNIWGKTVLKKLPHPMTMTVMQMGTNCVVLPMLMSVWNKRRRTFSRKYFVRSILPLSMLKLVASMSSFITLLQVPVSYAHTVKALMPVCSVTLTRLILGQQTSWRLYFALIPIVSGVVLASATQLELNYFGLVAALSSTLLLSSQTIFSKQAMGKVDHLNLLLVTSQMAFVMLIPIWLWHEGWALLFGNRLQELGLSQVQVSNVMLELLAASLCNFTQSVAAFTFLSLVQPVTYSVANVSKRLVVITLSIIYFKQESSMLNTLGMAMAIGGVGLYNYVKNLEQAEKSNKVQQGLPTHVRNSARLPNSHIA